MPGQEIAFPVRPGAHSERFPATDRGSPDGQTARVLILAADGFEDSELLVPLYRLREEGYAVDVAAPHAGQILGKHGYQDAEVVVDHNVVTARQPADLPAFLRETMKLLRARQISA
ncbi:MAG TPA: DJ-1/PfpI family protein [Burkholderiales bacterium]|nr:DJ-1/PfpI family protein [Burkholderiales bacterium]